jgi:hypothetical protein
MIAALSPASSAFESCACNRETSLLAARNELVAHKTRKLNMSIRAEMRHLDQLGLPVSINFRLYSARRDRSRAGRIYPPSLDQLWIKAAVSVIGPIVVMERGLSVPE